MAATLAMPMNIVLMVMMRGSIPGHDRTHEGRS